MNSSPMNVQMKKSCFRNNLFFRTGINQNRRYFFVLLLVSCTVLLFHLKAVHAQPKAVPTPITKNGDVNKDTIVNFADIEIIFNHWHQENQADADQFQDNVINSFDFSVTAQKILSKP